MMTPPDGWRQGTDVALLYHLERVLKDLETRVFDRFKAIDSAANMARTNYEAERAREREAIREARDQVDKHLASLNEWERTFRNWRSDYITKAEVQGLLESALGRLDNANARLDKLEKWQERQTGRSQQTTVIFGAILGLSGVALAIFGFLAGQ